MGSIIQDASSTVFPIELHRGDIKHIVPWEKFGHNPAVGTSHEDVWINGDTYQWPTTPQTLEVISTSANDTAAGTGARSVRIIGLDQDWNEIEETVATNGTSASAATVNQFIRVNRAYVQDAGQYASTSAGSNHGKVTIRQSGAGSILGVIDVDGVSKGQTEQTMFSVPAGKTALIGQVSITVEANKTAEVNLFIREGADIVTAPFSSKKIINEYHGVTGSIEHVYGYFLTIPEKSDMWTSSKTSSGTSKIVVSYSILVVDYDPKGPK